MHVMLSLVSSEFAGLTTFEHWPIRASKWIGDWDPTTASYKSINYTNIQHGLDVIRYVSYDTRERERLGSVLTGM